MNTDAKFRNMCAFGTEGNFMQLELIDTKRSKNKNPGRGKNYETLYYHYEPPVFIV